MENEQAPQTHRSCLPPGTRVGDWRVERCQGHGAQSIVYRALKVGHEAEGPVALKMALYPWDPRLMREVALLSLIHHPSLPRLYGQGFFRRPSGIAYPFLVMEWVEGTPLYDWAPKYAATSRQVLQLLAQLARVLEATHAASAVHRDVKGDNILVRHSDGRAVLTDFGSGHYQASARLTWQPLPPGTPAYRSPEAGLFIIRSVRSPGAHYLAGPEDDVFSLGVTAYRLVTGDYPPEPEPLMDEEGSWQMVEARVRPPRELNPRVEAQLSALILRMLSLSPEARGLAGELAKALEAAAAHAGPEADQPLFDKVPEQVSARPAEPKSRARLLRRRHWSALAVAAVFLLVWGWRAVRVRPERAPASGQMVSYKEWPDACTTDLGDTAPDSPIASVEVPLGQESIAQDKPPRPFPGQLQPDARGKCPGREQVPLNGGCWVESRTTDAEACEQSGYVFVKDRCYSPALAPRRKPQPTSNPPDFR